MAAVNSTATIAELSGYLAVPAMIAVVPLAVVATASFLVMWQQKRSAQLGQRYFGRSGIVVVSLLGGLVSSASAAPISIMIVVFGLITIEIASKF